jgi:two-component system, chemotaxis family, CheB/CheR fusion protein
MPKKSAVSKKPAKARKEAAKPEKASTSPFITVGIGASAGGLEAMLELLRNLPEKPDAAFVIIHHADPSHPSALRYILERESRIRIVDVVDGMKVDVNTVYIAPGGADITLKDEVLHVRAVPKGRLRLPIDFFFRSLAEDRGARAVAVVLSGSASDGALGAKAVKAEGGIVFAQDESAKFDSMPRSAIAADAVDFVLPPKEIAREIVRIARHSYALTDENARRLSESQLGEVFSVLRSSHDVDFTHYKPNTVERRIRRRMAVNKLEILDDYLSFLRGHPAEVDSLYNDLLIRVTAFFRDPEVFERLKTDILPALMRDRDEGSPVRIWVPGCATGEEVYSIAICAMEVAANYSCPVQIFGTDISDTSVNHARAGIYPENIAVDVSPDRLRRFFMKVDGSYRVTKAVRDCCVFARQNLTKDPPFSKLDLISCRNVMIYLGSMLQRKVMSIFHYALRSDGQLLLGASETIGSFTDLFTVTDRKHKFYRKRAGAARPPVDFQAPQMPPRERNGQQQQIDEEPGTPANIFREADRVLLGRFSPAGVLINDSMEILQFRGRTSAFLEPAPGAASFNLLKMAREGLLAELRTAIHNARKKGTPARRERVSIRNSGKPLIVNIEVIPFITPLKERFHLVMFEEAIAELPEPKTKGSKAGSKADNLKSQRLKRELEATREYLQSIIEEQEAMNEELRSANEEIQSSNEELQSTNEELETAKEELQSSNEELTTLNEELENRNEELAQANNDLVNLLASVDIPIVMLDSELRIRRFNPGAQKVLGVIAADIGRSLHNLKLSLRIDSLEELVVSVIEELKTREMDVQDRDGQWYSLRIRPYRTMENKIDGAVLVLIDMPKRT